MREWDQIVIDVMKLKAAQESAPRSEGPFRGVQSPLSGVETTALEMAETVDKLRAEAESLGADMSFLDVEPEWTEAKPPIGPLIECERDNGRREVGRLALNGAESISPRGDMPDFHDLYTFEGGSELFTVVRWRCL